MSDFAARLLHARSVAGITQRELAERTGISTVQLSRYESGKSKPRPPVLMKVAKALAVNHEWLGGSDAHDSDEIHLHEVELPGDVYDETVEIADKLGVPHELFVKMLLFLSGSKNDALGAEERERMKVHADRLLDRIHAISSAKRPEPPHQSP